VGEDDEHARALAWPERLATLDFLAGDPKRLESARDAARRELSDAQRARHTVLEYTSDIVGGVPAVRDRLVELVETTGADEIAAVSNIHDPADRRASFERLAVAAGVRDR
jgi:alkanesulfonate monooxygenase SsuD/methylene tetrahydromethanopterin reductase-like flavin-dependent oxidoreductase (luciferase family)